MGRKLQTTDWYKLNRILKYIASYYVIIGERSNGKTYSVKQRILELIQKGKKFIYMRRRHSHITRQKMFKLFSDINETIENTIGDAIKYSTEKGFFYNDGTNDITVGYAVSVEDAYLLKGIPYNDVDLILFDEFLDYEYFENETVKFLHIISTIVRDRTNVEIFMLANTVSKYSPYFELFGIDINKIKQGEIAHIKHKNGVTISVEYCKSKVETYGVKKQHKYLGFDENNTVNMILYGEWEYSDTNIKSVDGISWSSQRTLIPCYLTALNQVYELTLSKSKIPVAFARKLNTQQGKVRNSILYNLSYDNSVILNNNKGVVTTLSKVSNKFMAENVINMLDIFYECMRTSRIVYDSFATGTEFSKPFREMMK